MRRINWPVMLFIGLQQWLLVGMAFWLSSLLAIPIWVPLMIAIVVGMLVSAGMALIGFAALRQVEQRPPP